MLPRTLRVLALILAMAAPTVARAQARPAPAAKPGQDDHARALAASRAGDWALAATLFERVYEKGGYKNALFNLAECYEQLGRYREAVTALERLRKHPRVAAGEVAEAARRQTRLRARLATATVTANVTGAQVVIDGRAAGPTPATVEVDPGRHVIELSSPGFRLERREVLLVPGQRTAVEVPMSPLAARLRVVSRPAGAEVRSGGRVLGRSPLTVEVAAGTHRLVARLPGHRPRSVDVLLRPAETLGVELALERERAQVTVESVPAGATVELAGRAAGATPLRQRPLPPGALQIRVSRPGFQPIVTRQELRDGEETQLAVRLRRGRLHPVWFGSAVALSGAALITGGVLLGVSVDRAYQYREALNGIGDLPTVKSSSIGGQKTAARALAASSDRFQGAGVGTLVAGGTLALGAVVMVFFTRFLPSELNVRVAPEASGAVVGAHGQF